jgi:hypothetical protein
MAKGEDLIVRKGVFSGDQTGRCEKQKQWYGSAEMHCVQCEVDEEGRPSVLVVAAASMFRDAADVSARLRESRVIDATGWPKSEIATAM